MSLAIVVPYRNRGEHLAVFRPHMREYLRGIDAHIFVIEQRGDAPFNRGKLCNIGFLESQKYSHVVFHDVDMLPIEVSYAEQSGATHLATAVSQFEGKVPYPDYFGGVTMFDRSSFKSVNGFSNNYWGWGLEDDDLRERCRAYHVPISRRPDGKFDSLSHPRNESGPPRESIATFSDQAGVPSKIFADGLSNCVYSLVDSKQGTFTTWMLVDVGA
jgi:hypothetical protein